MLSSHRPFCHHARIQDNGINAKPIGTEEPTGTGAEVRKAPTLTPCVSADLIQIDAAHHRGQCIGVDISPNPPKDTDGRREGSGRGWVRELQGRWPGVFGVDGRPADGLQAPHRAPKALCGRPRPAPELLQGGLLVRRGGGHGGQRRAGGEQDVRKAPYHGQLHQLESPTGVCSAVGGGGLGGGTCRAR